MKIAGYLAIMAAICGASVALPGGPLPPFAPSNEQPLPPFAPLILDPIDAMTMGGHYEGDIILNEEQKDMVNEGRHPSERNVVKFESMRWPDNTIPYVFKSGAFTSQEENTISTYLQEFAKVSCINVVPRTNQQHYIEIANAQDGCWSYVGYQGEAKQQMNLQSNGCIWKTTVMHEFMHAAGFWHEQSRTDRDSFIEVVWDNIQSGMAGQFEKAPTSQSMMIGNYDYQSVMQYKSNAFAKSSNLKTMVRKDGSSQELGQGVDGYFTQDDISKMNQLYQCGDSGNTTPATTSATTAPPTCSNLASNCASYSRFCSASVIQHYCPAMCGLC